MKRRDLIRHLEQHGCYLDREGGRHSIYRNPQNGRAVAVPRHREVIRNIVFDNAKRLYHMGLA